MQELKNDTFANQYTQNGDNYQDIGKSISDMRFIECIRCGKQIKNDPKVIKNHEYYCRTKELAAKEYKMDELSSENEYTDNKYMDDSPEQEKATVEPFSDKKPDDSVSFSGIVLIGIAVSIIGAIIIVYKILAQKKQSASNITQTAINEQELSAQSPRIIPLFAFASLP
jgi:hypothetical protein